MARSKLLASWCYVIVSDHIHLFCAPNLFPVQPLTKWIEYWRNQVTRYWSERAQVPIWQREYWDRQLRRPESYAQKVALRDEQSGSPRVRPTAQEIGLTKANSMCWNGMTDEHGRRSDAQINDPSIFLTCPGSREVAPQF